MKKKTIIKTVVSYIVLFTAACLVYRETGLVTSIVAFLILYKMIRFDMLFNAYQNVVEKQSILNQESANVITMMVQKVENIENKLAVMLKRTTWFEN
jgi:hypothetical protein